MAKSVNDLVIYLQRNYITFFGGGLEKIIKLPLDKEFFRDLEILDRVRFVEEVGKPIPASKSTAHLNVIFSESMSFVEDLDSNLNPEQTKDAVMKFRNLIPFDEVAITLLKKDKSLKVVGINWEIYRAIIEAITPKGFTPLGVLSEISLPNFNKKEGLSEKTGLLVIQKQKSLKHNNFYTDIEEGNLMKNYRNPIVRIIKNIKPVIFLIGVFTFLLTILLFLVVTSL